MSVQAGIYALDPFSGTDQTAVGEAGSALAGFDYVMLASFHISSSGDINFNDTTMASGGKVVSANLAPNLKSALTTMKGSHGTILMSFGGGGCFGPDGGQQAIGYFDFSHLHDLFTQYGTAADNPFLENLSAIFAAYPIDGVDIDLEVYESDLCSKGTKPAHYSDFTDTLTTLTGWLGGQGKRTTIAPYESWDFWADLLARTFVNGTQQIARANVQGGPLVPDDGSALIAALQGKTTGISDPAAFVSSGMQIYQGVSAQAVQNAYSKAGVAAGGGWLWNFNAFPAPYGGVAPLPDAIRNGIQAP